MTLEETCKLIVDNTEVWTRKNEDNYMFIINNFAGVFMSNFKLLKQYNLTSWGIINSYFKQKNLVYKVNQQGYITKLEFINLYGNIGVDEVNSCFSKILKNRETREIVNTTDLTIDFSLINKYSFKL